MTNPSRKRHGCSPLAVSGCGCGLAAMIGIAFIFFTLGVLYVRERKDPRWNNAAYRQCQMNMRNLGRAIESYRLDYGKLPADLSLLNEQYISRKDWLRCPTKARDHVESYYYTLKPDKPTDPLITCVNHAQGPVTLLHDGKLRLSDDALKGDYWKRHPRPAGRPTNQGELR